MGAMHQADAAAAARIRALMFVFDDLARLSRQDLQLVVRAVKTQDLALALKGAAAPVKDAILGTMSERARAMLLDEIGMLGPQRLRDVDKAQQTVISMAEALADEGRIILRKTEEDDAVLVERLGHPVALVPGSPTNIKITSPEDLAIAEALLAGGVGAA